MTTTTTRPRPDEYAEYYGQYIAKVPDGDIVEMLRTQIEETVQLLRPLTDAQAREAYAPGKWTIKEVVGHMSDAERIFAYRALRFGRGDDKPLTGFDENAYVPAGHFDRRSLGDLLDEFQSVRAATVHLIRQLDADDLGRRGAANNQPISVRALAWIIAGHERHHRGLLRERYGVGAGRGAGTASSAPATSAR